MTINLESLEPQVAAPYTVDNVSPAAELSGTRISQAFVGSCTNGRTADLRVAAEVLQGKQVHSEVRLLVTPASLPWSRSQRPS